MKSLNLLCLLFPVIAMCQKSDVVTDSADMKAAIFSKSLAWVTTTWKSANDVIQMKDADAGTIIVKGGLSAVPKTLGSPAKGLTTTMVTIHVKDGKAKIEFSGTEFKWAIGTVWTTEDDKSNGQFTKWKDASYKEMDDLITSYKAAITKKDADF